MENMLEFLSQIYYPVLLIATFYFFILSLANHYEMWRFTLAPEIFDGPLVSVLIPARNEEKNIERCLDSLRNQLYKNYEILVINDNSTDDTPNILNRIAAEDKRVHVFNGDPLPDDWFGKPFALHQVSQHAKGDILLFTDADTIHNPTSISWAVTNITGLKADMISGYVGQDFRSFGEAATVPLMFFLTGFVIPLFINRFTKLSFFSSAVGQYIAIRHNVFKAIGGCES
ncbi:MAG: glycosyltransferase family 2 protein, partial [Treponema sp.]|nr:glycosyltransferase family 2 protein [Treponema sp.]